MKYNLKKINQLKKKYDQNGYVVIKDLFKKQEINKAGDDLEEFVSKNLKKFKGRDINKTKNNIINSVHFMNNWNWSKKFKNNNQLKNIVQIFLEDQHKDFGSELFAKPAKVGLASPMHQDNFYWCIDNANGLTIWIALDDSNKRNGGVFYFNKTHKMGLLEHTKSYAPGSSQTLKYPDSMKFFEKSIDNRNFNLEYFLSLDYQILIYKLYNITIYLSYNSLKNIILLFVPIIIIITGY